jgi:hypothetical protein
MTTFLAGLIAHWLLLMIKVHISLTLLFVIKLIILS